MKKWIILLLCILFAQNANALYDNLQCDSYPIKINIKTNPGKVVYNRKHARKEFPKLVNSPVNPNTLGLTVTNLNISMDGSSFVKKSQNRMCVGLKEINFTIGYDVIKVYIDKKYPVNSCNFKVIKDHEDYHVGVAQEAMRFFQPDIERELKKIVENLKPEYVYSDTRAQQIMDKQFQEVQEKMKPLLNHINKKIAEKNYKIDTPESYKATTKLCPHW